MTDPHALTRRQFTGLGLASAFAVLASCGSDQGTATSDSAGDPSPSGIGQDGGDIALPSDPAPAVVAAANQFAAELYVLAIEEADNLAFSPLSIAIALAMTSAGARSSSREQIEAVFHLTDVDDPHGGWNTVAGALASRSGTVTRDDGSSDELALAVVNRLWAQSDFPIEEAFLAVMEASYASGVDLLDFRADPAAARRRINEWVAEQTHERIPELIPEGVIDRLTRLVLTNAVYFKAPWASAFPSTATGDRSFTRLDGSTAWVPTMSSEGPFGTHVGEGWQAVELAYAGDQLEMVVVLPEEGRFVEVEAQLGDGLLESIPAGLDRRRQPLFLPRFEIRTPLPLNDALTALGMPDPFDPEVADFTGVNAERGLDLYINAVVHEAFVSVDESGTEAAAATAVVINEESAGPAAVVVDRPFLWAIRDIPTGAILFLGRVVDPSITA